MVAVKRIITVTFVALAFTATACANMTVVSPSATAPVSSPALDRQAVSGKGEAQSGQRLAFSAERLAQNVCGDAENLPPVMPKNEKEVVTVTSCIISS